ncbi:MAG: DUF3667 domain-containing protein [Bacteroidales bacterium]|nr:DUF3667 domain-containing protein [Bacteroidales bacterium]
MGIIGTPLTKGVKKVQPKVRWRAFRIWQKLGYLPWSRPKKKSKKGDFYEGAFDSIPFLNQDAKRTFVHLLLRPGYMIRDYIKGQHERYLAPLTSLIIFYAFFALISSIVNPELPSHNEAEDKDHSVQVQTSVDSLAVTEGAFWKNDVIIKRIDTYFDLLSLDKHPELVDTPAKASLAALEGAIRNKGIDLFLGNFLLLWMAMWLALKKRGMSISACAAASAYILCQFCFFMFLSLFLSKQHQGEIGGGLTAILLMIDYRQLLGVGWKKSFRLTLRTLLFYILVIVALVALLIGIVLLFLWLAQ